jgi:hypothetical protein
MPDLMAGRAKRRGDRTISEPVRFQALGFRDDGAGSPISKPIPKDSFCSFHRNCDSARRPVMQLVQIDGGFRAANPGESTKPQCRHDP